MGSTVATECLSEHMTALKPIYYQLVTTNLRLIAEVLGLGLVAGDELCDEVAASTQVRDHEAV